MDLKPTVFKVYVHIERTDPCGADFGPYEEQLVASFDTEKEAKDFLEIIEDGPDYLLSNCLEKTDVDEIVDTIENLGDVEVDEIKRVLNDFDVEDITHVIDVIGIDEVIKQLVKYVDDKLTREAARTLYEGV